MFITLQNTFILRDQSIEISMIKKQSRIFTYETIYTLIITAIQVQMLLDNVVRKVNDRLISLEINVSL